MPCALISTPTADAPVSLAKRRVMPPDPHPTSRTTAARIEPEQAKPLARLRQRDPARLPEILVIGFPTHLGLGDRRQMGVMRVVEINVA